MSETDATESHAPPSESPPIGIREVSAVAGMLLMFVAAQLLAVLLTRPLYEAGVRGFEDPEDPMNVVYFIGIILVFTAVLLFIVKRGGQRVIQWIILTSVGLTLLYVMYPLLMQIPGFERVGNLDAQTLTAIGISLPFAAALTWLLYKFPEWYIVDIVGVLVAAGGIAIFGTSFTAPIYALALLGTAIYDYVSVYRTKHMLSLADTVLNYKLPIMLVVPKHLDYSFLEETGNIRAQAEGKVSQAPQKGPRKQRDAMFLGLGDVVIPSIFVITALGVSGLAAAGAMLGTLAGFLFLMFFVLKGRAHAGLPSLNTGCFLGFLVGFYIDHGTIVFWN